MTQLIQLPPKNPDVSWLGQDKNVDTEDVQASLRALAFWRIVEEQSIPKALGKAKTHNAWDVTKKLDQQSNEARAYYELVLQAIVDGLAEQASKSKYIYSRLAAAAGDRAWDRAEYIQDVMVRTQALITLKMEEEGLYKYLEVDSTKDYLRTKQEQFKDTSSGIIYELDFMITYLIPALEANGYSRKLIFDVGHNFLKARYAVPYLRKALDNIIKRVNDIRAQIKTATDDEEKASLEKAVTEAMKFDSGLKDMLDALIKEIAVGKKSGGLSAVEFRQKMTQLASKNADERPKALGYVYNLSDGAILSISVDDRRQLETIKRTLEKMVDWHLGEPEDLVNEIGKRLLMENITQND